MSATDYTAIGSLVVSGLILIGQLVAWIYGTRKTEAEIEATISDTAFQMVDRLRAELKSEEAKNHRLQEQINELSHINDTLHRKYSEALIEIVALRKENE